MSLSAKKLGMMQDCSQNLAPCEIIIEKNDVDWEITCHDGTKLVCPNSILPQDCPENETKLHAALQYLLRYKFPQFNPALLPKVSPPTSAYSSILHIRHTHSFMHLEGSEARLCQEKFRLKPGDCILECGPFIGFSTVNMAQCVGSEGRVVSCEMEETNIAAARHNIQLNNLQQVTIIHAATAGQDGTVSMYRGTHQANSIMPGVVEAKYTQTVPALTLCSVCEQQSITPNFIILSINGAELSAIRGSKDFLSSLKNVRLIAVGMYKDEEGVIGPRMKQELESIGYTVLGQKTLYAFK